MATKPWKFLINSFYAQTFDTFKNALSLTNDHLAKLTAAEADPDILSIKTNYLPAHNTFITCINQLESKQGIYHGKTQNFEEMLEELAKTRINLWRGKVFAVFPEGSADAHAIFPRDRAPFQSDTYDQRVENVESLSLTLATYTGEPTLVTLSSEVHAYYLTLTGARALQQTDEGSVDILRSNLREAHVILCNGLYKNLGLLMAKYYTNPVRVADYFDLTLLRTTGDEPIRVRGTVNSGQVLNINSLMEDLGLDAGSILKLRVTEPSGASLTFYSAYNPTDGPGSGPQFTVTNPTELEKTVADFQFGTFPQFNIYNPGPGTAAWEIEVVEE
jgi:hypothetical protein